MGTTERMCPSSELFLSSLFVDETREMVKYDLIYYESLLHDKWVMSISLWMVRPVFLESLSRWCPSAFISRNSGCSVLSSIISVHDTKCRSWI